LLASGLWLLCAAAPTSAQSTAAKRPPGALERPKIPESPKVPTTFEGLFAERDKRAVGALGFLSCLQGTVTALQAGKLGSVPRDWSIACVEHGREWRGVLGQLTANGINVRLQYAFRPSGPVVTTDRVDTARVSGTARALLRGLSAPLPGAGRFEYTAVPLWFDTFIEVWFLPVPSSTLRVVVGGDSLIQMSADGAREMGHARSTPPIRSVSVPGEGATWTIESSEERIPTVSELVVARQALGVVAEVHIRTRKMESVINRRGRWAHRPR
jgi:hypothetical protein